MALQQHGTAVSPACHAAWTPSAPPAVLCVCGAKCSEGTSVPVLMGCPVPCHSIRVALGQSPAPAVTAHFVSVIQRKGEEKFEGTCPGVYWAASSASSGACGFFPSFWINFTMCVRSRLRVRMSSSTSSFWTPSMNSSSESSPVNTQHEGLR